MTTERSAGRATGRINASVRATVRSVGILVGLMWVSETIDLALGGRLDALGIEPREVDGLTGVVAAPFLHAGFVHLLANTTGLLVLGVLLAATTRTFWVTCALITVIGGFAVWLVAPSSTVHLGASGLLYGIAAYLVARGVLERRVVTVAVAVVVVVLYGGLVLGLAPGQEGISWQSHLFGAMAGALVAWLGRWYVTRRSE